MSGSKSLSTYAYDKLKDMILNNEFAPGFHLEEKYICELLGISRTPIREALNRLVYEKLLISVPKKGIYVPSLSVQSIAELFQARKLIEPMVLMLSAKNLDGETLQNFRAKTLALIRDEDISAIHRLDYDFHAYINSCCNNQHIQRTVDYISDLFQCVRTQDFYPMERALNGAHEHIEIIDNILDRQYDVLPQLMLNHITSTETFYFKSLQNTSVSDSYIQFLTSTLPKN